MSKRDIEAKKFLDPELVSKLDTLELKARKVVEGFMVGLHKSPYHGFSVEFSEHRAYNQGDPIRNIDWKVFAKREKYYIKQFEEETNLISHINIDISASMGYKHSGSVTKLEYGTVLAASLAYIMLKQQDSVGLSFYSDKIDEYLPPKSNKVYLKTLLTALGSLSAGNKTETGESLNLVAEKISKRGLVIIISDFFDSPDSIMKALKHFRYKKNEVIVFQILDPIEKSFAFGGDSVFVDMETAEEINTNPAQVQKAYQKAMGDFLTQIKTECRNYGIEYNLIETTTPYDKAILSYYQKRKRLK